MIDSIIHYIRRDFQQNPLRAMVEIFGMACGVGASILLAITTPEPAMFACYVMWLFGSGALFLCAISRGSTGLAISYISYFLIDVIGILRTIYA
jgi:hypothetical protein